MISNYRNFRQTVNFQPCACHACESSRLWELEKTAKEQAFFEELQRSMRDWEICEKNQALETIRQQYGGADELVIFAKPDGMYRIWTWEEAAEYLQENEIAEDRETAFDGTLVVGYDQLDVFYLGRKRYLSSPMIVYGLDAYGEVCGIDGETLLDFLEGLDDYRTVLEVDGKAYPVFRLD